MLASTQCQSHHAMGIRIRHISCLLIWSALWGATNATTTWRIGLVSDDYDFVAQAPRAWYLPFDTIHWSPLLHGLFANLAAQHWTPQMAHVGISLVHAGVCLALAALLRWGLGVQSITAWLGAMLWAVSPAASESVYWLCASGNVVVSLALLTGLCLALRPGFCTWPGGLALALLQGVACLAWDWGVLLLPTAMLVAFVAQGPRKWRTCAPLLPGLGVWLAYQGIRRASGASPGYGWLPEGVLRAAKDVLLAPAMTFAVDLPQPVRVALGLVCWCVMVMFAKRNRCIAALVVGFAFLQLPSMLLGVLQARYLYLSGPLFYAAMLKAADDAASTAAWRRFLLVVCTALIGWQAWCYHARAGAWRDASLQARALAETLQEHVQANGYQAVALLNVPDSYGDPQTKWRPFVWRRGLQTQLPQALRVYSEDFLLREGMKGLLLSAEVPPGVPVIEIVNQGDARRPRYAIAHKAAQPYRSDELPRAVEIIP